MIKETMLNVYGFEVLTKYREVDKKIEIIKTSLIGGAPGAIDAGQIVDECKEILESRMRGTEGVKDESSQPF